MKRGPSAKRGMWEGEPLVASSSLEDGKHRGRALKVVLRSLINLKKM